MIPLLAAEAIGQIASNVLGGGTSKHVGTFTVPAGGAAQQVPAADGHDRLHHQTHAGLLGLQEAAPGPAVQADDMARAGVQTG